MHIYEKYRQFYNRVFCESKHCRYADVYPHVQCTQYKHLHLSHPALLEFLRAFRRVFCRFRFRDYQGGYKYLFQLTNHKLFCLWKLRHTHSRQFFRWVRLQYKGTFERSFYAICKFFNGWNIVFKCYCRVFNIWFVYSEQFFGVAYLCHSDMQFIIHNYDLFNTLWHHNNTLKFSYNQYFRHFEVYKKEKVGTQKVADW